MCCPVYTPATTSFFFFSFTLPSPAPRSLRHLPCVTCAIPVKCKLTVTRKSNDSTQSSILETLKLWGSSLELSASSFESSASTVVALKCPTVYLPFALLKTDLTSTIPKLPCGLCWLLLQFFCLLHVYNYKTFWKGWWKPTWPLSDWLI